MSADKIPVGMSVRNIEETPAYAEITKVRVFAGQNSKGEQIIYTYPQKGGNSGRILDVDIPWGTSKIAENIYKAVSGYAYKPYAAEDAFIDPAMEIGDSVVVGNMYSVIAEADTDLFSPLMNVSVRARDDGTIDHEYPYISQENRDIKRAITENKTALIIQEGTIQTIVQELGTDDTDKGTIVNRLSKVEQTADGVSLYIEKSEGPLYNKISSQAGTVAQSKVESWANINFKADKISSVLGTTYATPAEVKTAKNDAIATAKQYTNGEIQSVTKSYQSEISQESTRIQLSVAAAESKWDLTELKKNWNVTISKFGFTEPDSTNVSTNQTRPSKFKNKYYLDQTTGYIYKSTSDGTNWSWVKQSNMSSDAADKTKALHLITANLSSRIEITENGITSVVTEDDLKKATSKIIQQAKEISLEVSPATDAYGNRTGGTKFSLSGFGATLQTEEFDVAVKSMNIKGTISADNVKANASIQSPSITGANITTSSLTSSSIYSSSISGGTVSGAEIIGGSYTSPQKDVYLSMTSDYNANGTLFFGPYNARLSRYSSYMCVNAYTQGYNRYVVLDIGGRTLAETQFGSARWNLGGIWDFSQCSKVIMPDGTIFEP